MKNAATQQQEQSSAIQDGLQAQINKLQKRLERLRDTYADGDITREEFLNDKQRYTEQFEKLKQQIQDLETSGKDDASGIDIKRIEATLNQWIDLSAPVIPEAVIDQFILQVVRGWINDTFNWTLDFSSN